jgi:hypothetical protein
MFVRGGKRVVSARDLLFDRNGQPPKEAQPSRPVGSDGEAELSRAADAAPEARYATGRATSRAHWLLPGQDERRDRQP